MKKLILLVGPPGSGKSTMAKQSFGDFTYINQDLQGRDHLNIFDLAILSGENVVVDRMNFNKIQRHRYLSLAKEHGYETEVVVIHESYRTCLDRCLARQGHLTIKDEKSARAALQTFFTKYERVEDDEADKVTRVWPSGVKDRAIIIDLDGTMCNLDHRLHFVRTPEGVKKDWKSFFFNLREDKVNEWCKDIAHKFSDTHKIVYCSGRPDDHKKATLTWLEENDVWFGELYMRHRGDHRQDYLVKEMLLDFELLTRFDPYFIIDDRSQVVDMWRKRGYTVLQCANGNF